MLFKLVIQFSDRVRISDVGGPLPSNYNKEFNWQVLVRESDLALIPFSPKKVPWWILPAASIVVELFVAGLYFQVRVKIGRRRLMERLLIILLANLVTLPVVWIFFPSLGQFRSVVEHEIGIFSLVASFLLAFLLIAIYAYGIKIQRFLITILVIALSGKVTLCLLVMLGSTNRQLIAQGLPSNTILLMSEGFAVLVEWVLVVMLSKKVLTWRQAGLISLLMNLASFLAGQLLAGLWL